MAFDATTYLLAVKASNGGGGGGGGENILQIAFTGNRPVSSADGIDGPELSEEQIKEAVRACRAGKIVQLVGPSIYGGEIEVSTVTESWGDNGTSTSYGIVFHCYGTLLKYYCDNDGTGIKRDYIWESWMDGDR